MSVDKYAVVSGRDIDHFPHSFVITDENWLVEFDWSNKDIS